ncbi:MAG: signal peptidase I [Bacillota bacterium]
MDRQRGWWRDAVQTVLLAGVLALLIRLFVVEPFRVDGPSMEPTLFTGERLLVDKVSYRFHPPRRGDVVVFRNPGNLREDYIKRVVALPGDTVEMRLGRLYVNGQPVPEPYVLRDGISTYGPEQIPPGYCFVLGDNRANSRDSRFFGPVPLHLLKGRAWLIFWPPRRVHILTAPALAVP